MSGLVLSMPTILLAGAYTSALLTGGLLGTYFFNRREQGYFRKRLRSAVVHETASESPKKHDLVEAVLRQLIKVSQEQAFNRNSTLGKPLKVSQGKKQWLSLHAKRAGIGDQVSSAGFALVRVYDLFFAAGMGFLGGFLFSGELACLLCFVGACVGWRLPTWAIKTREKERSEELERHLPEMLEVVALGLRSGLSFDRSLDLYIQHFNSLLAQTAGTVRRRWLVGLSTREDALRDLADSYDSLLLARVVHNIIRSLRFGSSLAQNLEELAAEARAACKAHRQEQVAKAPIKMMIPTGVLMLPAMLLLVLGPVLLELMGEF